MNNPTELQQIQLNLRWLRLEIDELRKANEKTEAEIKESREEIESLLDITKISNQSHDPEDRGQN